MYSDTYNVQHSLHVSRGFKFQNETGPVSYVFLKTEGVLFGLYTSWIGKIQWPVTEI